MNSVEYVCVDGKLCVGPMPSDDEVREIAREFDVVISLAENVDYNPQVLGEKFIEVPTSDFRAPCLIHVHLVLDRVEQIVKSGGRVYVHCHSGRGRSGTFAAMYLVRMYSMSVEDSIKRIREVRPGAIETIEQEIAVKEYEYLLRHVGARRLTDILMFGYRYDFGRGSGHAWKVLDLSLQLAWLLKNELKLDDSYVANVLAPAAILHDIGVIEDEEDHHIHSYNILLNEGRDILGKYTHDVAVLVKHHRARTDPEQDPEVKLHMLPYIAILRIADALDHALDQSVMYLEYNGNELIAYIASTFLIETIERAVKKKITLLQKLLNKQLEVTFA